MYARLDKYLAAFERRFAFREEGTVADEADEAHEFILFGLGRYGGEIGRRLSERGHTVLGIDFDPEAVNAWRAAGQPGYFGDATDPEFIAHLPLRGVRGVIAAIPRASDSLAHADPRVALLYGLRNHGFRGKIAVAMHTATDAETLRRHGADVLLTPFSDAAEFAVSAIEHVLDEPQSALSSG